MHGYPAVTVGNDHITARFDNALVDAAPWAAGRAAADDAAWLEAAPELQPLHRALRPLEGRHPLALGHVVNHPPERGSPNVLLAPFDLTLPAGAPPSRCL